MDTIDPLRFILAFVFVIGLIGLLAMGLKRYGRKMLAGRTWLSPQAQGGRIDVVEMRYIDARRRLVLVRCDAKEYLLLLADGREMVIESGMMAQEGKGNG